MALFLFTHSPSLSLYYVKENYYCYQIIFKQEYNFLDTARTLEAVLQRVKDFLFLLVAKDTLLPILLIDSKDRELFNNVMHTTLTDTAKEPILELITRMPIYAKLRLRQHYAIPFTTVVEPFPLYRIAGDYYATSTSTLATNNNNNNDNINININNINNNTHCPETILFALHARQHSERTSIASFLRKHDLKRTSIFYAYGDQIRQKLQLAHYHCTLLLATTSRLELEKGLTAFKVQHFTRMLKGNNNRAMKEESRLLKELLREPKKPLWSNTRYPVLSSVELASLMLPDSIRGVRTTVDGIRPYTTGRML